MQYSLEYAKMSSGYFRDFFLDFALASTSIQKQFYTTTTFFQLLLFCFFFPFFWVEIPNITVENNELKEY